MLPNRYDILKSVDPQASTHTGLWLDKFLKGDGEEAKKKLVNEIVQTIKPQDRQNEVYALFYEGWKKALLDNGAVCREAKTTGRMAINLGAESVLETSIALHRTYGVPYIPGSALKGLAANYTRNKLGEAEWGKDSQAYRTLFGDTNDAGYVTFFDALYVPGNGHQGKPLWPDIITVHHPDYYQTGNSPAADWDNPTPIPFLTATGSYLVALSGDSEWVNVAFEILTLALENEGVGAKTSSGYGRLKFEGTGSTSNSTLESYEMQKRELLNENPTVGRLRGTVVNVQGNRYGRVNPARGGKQLFVHINQVKKGGKSLKDGQVVEYVIGQYEGKDQAQDVYILLEPEN